MTPPKGEGGNRGRMRLERLLCQRSTLIKVLIKVSSELVSAIFSCCFLFFNLLGNHAAAFLFQLAHFSMSRSAINCETVGTQKGRTVVLRTAVKSALRVKLACVEAIGSSPS